MKEKDFMNNPEFDALKDVEGVDANKLIETATGEKPEESGDEPPKPEGQGGDEPPKPEGQGGDEPPGTQKKDEPPVPSSQDDILKEIFGDRFKTIDEAKQANINGVLEEVESLRQAKIDLESQLSTKPKTNFANDEVALYNEFVKETGIRNYGVFEKINSAELANMDPMDALVTKHLFDHPELSGKEALVRKRFEKKYNVDPDQVDEETLELNKLDMETDGGSAKQALQELRGKLKIPEPAAEEEKPKELSPEEKSKLQDAWGNIGQQVSKALEKLKVPIKNGKESLLDYEVSESEQKEIRDFVASYAAENQMELDETNVRTVSHMVYNQLMMNKLPDIVHSVFEKARSLTEEEVHSLYENPSPSRNTDTPPGPTETPKGDAEKTQDDIFDAEMGRYNK
jgi:hypothetical protein